MAHSEKCPVCDGTGWYEPDSESDQECHGCDGRGWVTVRDKVEMSDAFFCKHRPHCVFDGQMADFEPKSNMLNRILNA